MIDRLHYRDVLQKLQIAIYPKMKDADRYRLHKNVYRAAYPDLESETVTLDELKGRLANG